MHLFTEVQHEILATDTCPSDANDLCIIKEWQMLISILILHSDKNKCYVQWEDKNISFRIQTLFLDPSDKHNLPTSLMLKFYFTSIDLH